MSLLVPPITVQGVTRLPQREYVTQSMTSGAVGVYASGTAYFTYVGQAQQWLYPRYTYAWMTSVGTGGQTAEVGLFYSLAAPSGSAVTLYKIVASGSVTDLTAGTSAVKGNTTAYDCPPVRPGTFLWCGIRTAMATTQPNFAGASNDWGKVMNMSGALSALTGLSTASPSSIGTATGIYMFLVTA